MQGGDAPTSQWTIEKSCVCVRWSWKGRVFSRMGRPLLRSILHEHLEKLFQQPAMASSRTFGMVTEVLPLLQVWLELYCAIDLPFLNQQVIR